MSEKTIIYEGDYFAAPGRSSSSTSTGVFSGRRVVFVSGGQNDIWLDENGQWRQRMKDHYRGGDGRLRTHEVIVRNGKRIRHTPKCSTRHP